MVNTGSSSECFCQFTDCCSWARGTSQDSNMKKTFLLNPVAGLKAKISYHIFNRNMEGKATQKAEVVPQPMAPLPEVTICPGLGKSADAKITQYDKNNLKVIK